MHEWIRIPATCSETSVPEGNVIDKFLQELEIACPEVKRAVSVQASMDFMTGKRFRWVKKKLGKSFEGYEARDYWTPIVKI